MKTLYKNDLQKMNCQHATHDGENPPCDLLLQPRCCHGRPGTTATYRKERNTLLLECAKCGKEICQIAVANETTAKTLTSLDSAIDHEDARGWYDGYGDHISTEHHGDICIQEIDYDWLDDDDDGVAKKLQGACESLHDSEIDYLVTKARSIRAAGEEIEALLTKSVESWERRDPEATAKYLDAASEVEIEHGDDPASSYLRPQLLTEDQLSGED